MGMARSLLLATTLLLIQACLVSDPNAEEGRPAAPGISYAGMKLTWADEFNLTRLDTGNWNYLYGTGYEDNGNGWGNNELQYYRSENTTVADGMLTITALKQAHEGSEYTSSRLTTDDKREITYGRIDTRAKLPIGQGIWPAIWMLGAKFPAEQGWPAAGEIDIMEFLGHMPNRLHGTVHYGSGPGENYRYKSFNLDVPGSEPLSDDFHLYSIDWRRDTIDWLFDGERYGRFTASDAAESGQAYPFNAPHYLLLNLAVGGNWPGEPDSTTVFPQEFVIDYVRIYQRKGSE